MDPANSPFTPDRPVSSDYFVGRVAEKNLLAQAISRSLQHGLEMVYVSGEQGIGKSSLVSYVRNTLDNEGRVAGIYINFSGVNYLDKAFVKIDDEIWQAINSRTWKSRMGFLRKINFSDANAYGVKFQEKCFDATLKKAVSALGSYKGLFLIWDDINRLVTDPKFANWLKSFMDSLSADQQKPPVTIALVGNDDIRDLLISNNTSVSRIFKIAKLKPWTLDESCHFFRNGFEKGNAIIAEKDIKMIAKISNGFPVLAHEIGDAIWKVSKSTNIQSREAAEGAIKASEIIGEKWLHRQVIHALNGEHYLSILAHITQLLPPAELYFSKREIAKQLTPDERKNFSNFLIRMKDLGALHSVPNKQGEYQFPNHMYKFYYWQQFRKGHKE